MLSVEFIDKNIVKFIKLLPTATLPALPGVGDAGYDIYSSESFTLRSGDRGIVNTGIASEFSEDMVCILKDRSGNAFKKGLHVLGGVIDSSYRGEWGIILVNLGQELVVIEIGDRVCQAIFLPICLPKVVEVTELSFSERQNKGFGSSGN